MNYKEQVSQLQSLLSDAQQVIVDIENQKSCEKCDELEAQLRNANELKESERETSAMALEQRADEVSSLEEKITQLEKELDDVKSKEVVVAPVSGGNKEVAKEIKNDGVKPFIEVLKRLLSTFPGSAEEKKDITENANDAIKVMKSCISTLSK